MTVDMQQIGIVADFENDMLVPDLVQHGTAGLFQRRSSLSADNAGGLHS
jgi:hypothetical protein